MDIRITVTGVEELARRYKRAPEIIRSELTTSMTKVVIMGEAIAKKLAPKWRGQLQRSIHHQVSPSSGSVKGEWGTALHYAKFVELGTRRHFVSKANIGAWASAHGFGSTGLIVSGKARPFIGPSGDQMKGGIRAEFNAAMGRIVARLSAG